MRAILRQSNLDLLREITRLSSALTTLSAPAEISTYQYWMTEACSSLRRRILQNLRDLELNRDDILDDILSETQLLTAFFRLCNQRLASRRGRAGALGFGAQIGGRQTGQHDV